MTPLLLSIALALAPAAAPPSAAPPAAAPAPAAAPSMAPAPSPAPAPAPAVAGPVAAPAPVAAPSTAIIAPPPGAVATSNTTVVPAGTSVTVNVYPPPPTPAPVPVVAVPVYAAPAAVIAPTVGKPDPAMVQHSIRKFRRSAIGVAAVGTLGMGLTLALQGGRLASLNRCAVNSRGTGRDELDTFGNEYGCNGLTAGDEAGASMYGALGLSVFVAGIGSAGSLFGKAAAHRDVQLRHGSVRPRVGLKILGVASIVGASIWMAGTNWTLLTKENQCATAACEMRYRPLRYAANDAGAIGLAAGSAMVAYAVSYEKQGRALMRIRAAPALTRSTAGISLSGQF